MAPHSPFTGTLLLPDRAVFGSESPVTLEDGRPVAVIRWHAWSMNARFEIFDPTSNGLLASGGKAGFWGNRYQLTGPAGQEILELKFGFSGPTGRGTVTLADGRVLRTRGKWTARSFTVTDHAGAPVAHLVNTSRVFAMRSDSLAFELTAPVLTSVEAIGLAQCVRAAVEAQNAAAAG
jgi:hypothetical protein